MTEQEVEEFIRASFEENFETLRMESGHSITPNAKQAALEQVLLYWSKLRDIAINVTDTEIKLTLPELLSSEGRKYAIEGVVDLVREEGTTWMYDIKTHDGDYVRANIGQYEEQLNVYAHIWQSLRKQTLDGMGVIATAPTQSLRAAIRSGDKQKIDKAISSWEPLVDIALDHKKVEETIAAFGKTVDCIENRAFKPASLKRLREQASNHQPVAFGTEVCRNCDARFSCESYRGYAMTNIGKADVAIKAFIDDFGSDLDRSDWLDGNLLAIENQLNT